MSTKNKKERKEKKLTVDSFSKLKTLIKNYDRKTNTARS